MNERQEETMFKDTACLSMVLAFLTVVIVDLLWFAGRHAVNIESVLIMTLAAIGLSALYYGLLAGYLAWVTRHL